MPKPLSRTRNVFTRDGEDGSEQIEVEDFDVGRGIGDDVGNGQELLLELGDGGVDVSCPVELGGAIDAAEGVGGVVLDGVAEDLVVADEGGDVIGADDGGGEEADLVDGAGDTAGGDEVADLERAEDDEEDAGGEVGEQAGPGGADGDAGGGDEGGEGGGFDTEVAEDGDDESDVESDADGGDQPLNERFFDLLAAERTAENIG